jgi:threonine/homoserine/homoserine lactone efflux protein
MIDAEFLLTSLVVVLMPGTGVIYTVSMGLVTGWRGGIAAAFGCTAGIVPHLTASILGLSAVIHVSAVAFQAVKFAGAVYLIYLAGSMWRHAGAVAVDTPDRQTGLVAIAVKGVLINILNPKLSIFFLAFLPLFVSPGTDVFMAELILLSLVFMAMTLVIFTIYGLLANRLRAYVANSPRAVRLTQRSFAVAFAALGVKLAIFQP